MTKISLLCLILIAALLNSCTTVEIETDIIVAGKILHHHEFPKQEEITIYVNDPISAAQLSFSGKIEANGYFRVEFTRPFPQDVLFIYPAFFQIIVHPGDSIFIELDAKDTTRTKLLKNIRFSGDAAKANMELAAYQLANFTTIQQLQEREEAIKKLSPQEYKSYEENEWNKKKRQRDGFIADVQPSEEVKLWTQYQVDMEYYTNLLQYPMSHRLHNRIKKQTDWDYGDDYFDFVRELPPINQKSLINTAASVYLINWYNGYVHEVEMKKVNYDFSTVINLGDSLWFSGLVERAKSKDLLSQLSISAYMNNLLRYKKIANYEKHANEAFRYIKAPFLREPLKERYLLAKENEESSPPPITQVFLKNLNEIKGKTYLDTILQKNRDKVLYIDFWATWCKPCIEELPHSEELRKKHSNRNLAFIFICLDSEKEKWTEFRSDLQLGGQHYFLTKEQGAAIKENLNIRGIPFYLLIDEGGNVKGHGFDFRPSNPLTVKKIEEVLR